MPRILKIVSNNLTAHSRNQQKGFRVTTEQQHTTYMTRTFQVQILEVKLNATFINIVDLTGTLA
jgi:hypothetical protein